MFTPEWPNLSLTILGCTPCCSNREAWAWRRSWKRRRSRPAAFASLRQAPRSA